MRSTKWHSTCCKAVQPDRALVAGPSHHAGPPCGAHLARPPMIEAAVLPMRGFYTYVHRRADDGKVFYVGKGKGSRANSTRSRNPYWASTARKHGVRVEIAALWACEAEAFEHEKLLISCFRDLNQPLCNLTDGGVGISGYRHSAETSAPKYPPPRKAGPSSAKRRERESPSL